MNQHKNIYEINVEDVQGIANEILERDLTDKEIVMVENSIGSYIGWSQAIENAIHENIHS